MSTKQSNLLFLLCILLGTSQANANQGVIKIEHIGRNGILIDQPGVYRFENNIAVNLCEGKAAITVKANNVNLDLNQFTLKQKGRSRNNIGILIKKGRRSVTVQNGMIQKIHGFGIQVEHDNNMIKLENLTIKSNGRTGGVLLPDNIKHTGGILFLGKQASPITEIYLNNVRALNNTTSNHKIAVNGLLMSDANNISIQNCQFNENFGTSESSVAGAEFFRIKNCVIQNSQADSNSNKPSNGANAGCFGFHFNQTATGPDDSTESANIKVLNATANQTTGKVIRAAGFRFRKARNLLIENSESNQTTNTLPDPANVDGTITAAGGFLIGFCDDFTIKNCKSSEHSTTNPSLRVVGGFDIARSNFGLIADCFAARCKNMGNGILAGFIVEPLVNRSDFIRNIGIIFENSVAEGNVGSDGGGFAFFKTDEGKIINCEAINNNPYGIAVGRASPDNTIFSIIKDNIVMSNGLGGIIDDTGNGGITVNAYLGNISRDNSASNFVNLPAGTPITNWLLSTGGTLNAQSNDNINIE